MTSKAHYEIFINLTDSTSGGYCILSCRKPSWSMKCCFNSPSTYLLVETPFISFYLEMKSKIGGNLLQHVSPCMTTTLDKAELPLN